MHLTDYLLIGRIRRNQYCFPCMDPDQAFEVNVGPDPVSDPDPGF